MKRFKLDLRIEQISARIPGKSLIRRETVLNNVAELKEADPNSVCFFENSKYIGDFKASRAGLIFVPPATDPELNSQSNLFFTEKPYVYFMLLVKTWLELSRSEPQEEISPTAVIPDSVNLGKNVRIGDHVVIGENTKIGDNTVIRSNTDIGENVLLGNDCLIFPGVTIYSDCELGSRVILHAGCVIGSDGFGYILHENKQNKIPQVGKVIVHDDVEIGANSTIDRGAIGLTVIGEGTKIDNLVQVGHNCVIGKHSIICAQVGLAGSTEIGDYVYLAGQVGVAGHLRIGDKALVGAQSGVAGDIPDGAKYFGTPAIEAGLRKRIIAVEKRIPGLVKKLNRFFKKQDQ